MIGFEFATSSQIIFGRGTIARLESVLPKEVKRILVISGRHNAENNPVMQALAGRDLEIHTIILSGEPEAGFIDEQAKNARKLQSEWVIAIGGGSVMDAGKAIAMLAANGSETLDYIEVVGRGQKITRPAMPMVAIPTTAGTGSEVTKNGVIIVREKNAKASLRSPLMIPRVALIDPELMVSLPPYPTAYTGMDALTQVMEAYLTQKANLFVDSLCENAMRMGFSALPKVFANGSDLDAREEMAYVSLVGGIALANAGLGAVHGFAASLGGMFDIPHGVICACFLPVVFETNYLALKKANKKHPALQKYGKIAAYAGYGENGLEALFTRLYELREQFEIPGMRKFGVERSMAGEIADLTANTSSIRGNPVALSRNDLIEILMKCI